MTDERLCACACHGLWALSSCPHCRVIVAGGGDGVIRPRVEEAAPSSTDERLCAACGHVEYWHGEGSVPLPHPKSGPACARCMGQNDVDPWHDFSPPEAAPSTDEGDEQWAREIADRWVNSATAEDRETVVLTECEKHPGVMPEWACPTCVRASLEAEVERLQGALRWAYDQFPPEMHGAVHPVLDRALATPPSSTEGTE